MSTVVRKASERLIAVRQWLAGKYREVPLRLGRSADAARGGVEAENVVWIFGTGRSGSTWLRSMMGQMSRHRVWEEPLVGRLFGDFYAKAGEAHLRRPDFVMADSTRRGWLRSIRNFVLDGARYANPRLGPGDYLVVKEPNGSAGAPLLLEALPESRMVLLIRDPRDVVASALDGAKEGNWLDKWRNEAGSKHRDAPDEDPDSFVRMRASTYVQQAGNAKRAYDAHDGPKTLLKYEDLRSDTLGAMKQLYSDLGIPADDGELARAVDEHAWENIPEGKKGEGKFYRKAKPGGWSEDLTPRQVRIVERITAPLLEEFYSRSSV